MRPRRQLRLICGVATALLLLLLSPGTGRAQEVAGGLERAWLTLPMPPVPEDDADGNAEAEPPKPPRLLLHLFEPDRDPLAFRRRLTLPIEAGPHVLTASRDGRSVYVLSATRSQKVTASEVPEFEGDRLSSSPLRTLPEGLRPVAAANAGGVVWVIAAADEPAPIGIDDAGAGGAGGDASAIADRAMIPPRLLGLPVGAQAEEPEADPTVAAGGVLPADPYVLLWHGVSGWTPMTLPAPALAAAEAAGDAGIALRLNSDGRPLLLTLRPDDGAIVQWTLDPDAAAGEPEAVSKEKLLGRFRGASAGSLTVIEAGEQPVAGVVSSEAIELAALRPSVLAPFARLERRGSGGGFGLFPIGGDIGLLRIAPVTDEELSFHSEQGDDAPTRLPPTHRLFLNVLDLEGNGVARGDVPEHEVGAAAPLPILDDPQVIEAADRLLLLFVLLSSTFLMLMFWRRDGSRQRPVLPPGLRPAGFGRRVAAALVDLLPGVAVAMLVTGIQPRELLATWPNVGPALRLEQLIPPAYVIATLILHTAIAEALTGRSLGKLVLRLRVTGLRGEPVPPMRAVLRCVLKCIELVAYLLLILVILSPFRQRLGDLIAGTVVVEEAPPVEPAGAAGA